MRKLLTLLLLQFVTLSSMAQSSIIYNVQGYTLAGDELIKFNAIQFTNDKIDKVFSQKETLPTSKEITMINGNGKTLLPGLIDAHGHVLNYGLSLLRVDLTNVASEKAVITRIKNYLKNNKSLNWIQGRGWNQVQWSSKEFPSHKSLDSEFADVPVWLKRVDGHAGWANSKAMALAGINAKTLSPNGGQIIKDKNGDPTGIFIDNAMDLIEKSIPQLTIEEQKTILIKAMNSLASLGLTSVHDAGINRNNIQAYKELTQNNQMPIRINAMLYVPSIAWLETLNKGTFVSKDSMFALNSIKIQADGALGSRGASLINDYSDKANHKGLLLHDQSVMKDYIQKAMIAGFQVNIHAIGDNANNLVLNQYQQLISQTKTQDLRHRIEHAQVLKLTDIPRFADLNIIASMQATHATSDKNMAQDRLGEQRILGAYAWRKLLNENVTIAAGSDFPVESANPLYGLHASVTRQDHLNLPKDGWFADEKMSRLEAFKSFTYSAAYAGHQEKLLGSLAKGKKADFILLEHNYFTMPESEIWQNEVLSTWVNGKNVYNRVAE